MIGFVIISFDYVAHSYTAKIISQISTKNCFFFTTIKAAYVASKYQKIKKYHHHNDCMMVV